MKNLIHWVLAATIICGSSLFTACTSDNDNAVSPNSSAEQTDYAILFYGFGGGNLDCKMVEHMMSMFNGKPESYKKVKVACQYKFSSLEDLNANWLDLVETTPEDIKETADMALQTIRFVADKNDKNAYKNFVYNTECIYGPKDGHSANVDSLTNFINWATEACPAKHYILAISGHGSGYDPYLDPTFEAPAKTRTIIEDYNNGSDYRFTASSLKYAISRAKARMDVIYLDVNNANCIEYQFELKNLADYFIMSSYAIPEFGSFYDKLIDQLATNGSDIEAALKNFNKAAVKTWDMESQKSIEAGAGEWKYYDMSVIRAKNLDNLGVKLKKFTDKLIDAYANEDNKAKIDEVTSKAFKVSDIFPRYDLARYTSQIMLALPDVFSEEFYYEFGDAYNSCQVSQYYSDYLTKKGIEIDCTIMLGVEGSFIYCYPDADDFTKIIAYDIFFPDGKYARYVPNYPDEEFVSNWGSTLADTYEKLEFDKATGWSRWLKLNKQLPNDFFQEL